jgi:hypothetical protein
MTSEQHIDYDALALEALRGVVKACLAQVSRTGLVGDHHFYIAFDTLAPGVSMSKRLREKYPLEMTIVLQHRFWDLAVDDDRFEVKLTFDGIPERLVVPFAAVKVFYDPSVPYVLQFEEPDAGAVRPDGGRRAPRKSNGASRTSAESNAADMAEAADAGGSSQDVAPERIDRRRPARKTRADRPADVTADSAAGTDIESPQPPALAAKKAPRDGSSVPTPPPAAKPPATTVHDTSDEAATAIEDPEATDAGGAKIFDLSKFRSKK